LNTTDTDVVYFTRILFVVMAGSRIKEVSVIFHACRSRVLVPFCCVSPLVVLHLE